MDHALDPVPVTRFISYSPVPPIRRLQVVVVFPATPSQGRGRPYSCAKEIALIITAKIVRSPLEPCFERPRRDRPHLSDLFRVTMEINGRR